MSDTSVTTEAPTTPPAPIPLPNDDAARSPTGEILEPAQIQAQQEAKTTPPTTTPAKDGDPAPTSTSKEGDGPPETYADFTLPENYTLDPKAVEAVTPLFKELGLTQEQAQKLISFQAERDIAAAKGPATEYENLRKDWKAKIEADPDVRGAVMDGKTGVEAVKIGISKTLAAIGDPVLTQEFKAAMDLTGAGDNPAFIKAMWKLSAFVTEGKHVSGTGPSPHGQRAPNTSERPTAARALYPNNP